MTKEFTHTVISQTNECTESIAKMGKTTCRIKSYFGTDNLANLLLNIAVRKMSKDRDNCVELSYNNNGEKNVFVYTT